MVLPLYYIGQNFQTQPSALGAGISLIFSKTGISNLFGHFESPSQI